jgi:mono/diheme cytochrome c family protein
MWVVGHFHDMALLNIGLLIFAAIYHFIPELTGKRLWSDDLAKWHIWLTFLAGSLNSAYWMIDGLRGSPRRFATSFEEYALLNELAVVTVGVLALAQILFVINMVQTLRGLGGRTDLTEDLEPLPKKAPRQGPSVNVGLGLATGTGFVLVSALILAMNVGDSETLSAAPATPTDPGQAVFVKAGCGGCHALAAAGGAGTVGPNLDQLRPAASAVSTIVAQGRGAMPAFSGQLTPDEIDQVADYVAGAAGP